MQIKMEMIDNLNSHFSMSVLNNEVETKSIEINQQIPDYTFHLKLYAK